MAVGFEIEKKILSVVRETIAAHRMFNPGDSVLVAVSGGPDSVTLAHVLRTLAADYCLRLAIAHLNHGLRGEDADRDAEFVAIFARQIDVPFFSEKKDVIAYQRKYHFSPEEAARKIRYQFYDAIATRYGFKKIALGHHSDDNAELVLMYLLRGSGPLGLSGIPPVRDGKIVRPLIHLKRSEIIDYLHQKNVPYVCDASNTDPTLVRNKIRHHLIPELKARYNPRIVETLNRLGSIIRGENQWLEDVLTPLFDQCVALKEADKLSLSLPNLGKLAGAAKRRIIRRAILSVKGDLRRITLLHIDAVLRLIENGPVCGSLNLPDGIGVERNRQALTVFKGQNIRFEKNPKLFQAVSVDYQYTIAAVETLAIKEANVSITLSELGADNLPDFKHAGRQLAFFDMDRLQFPLVVRNHRAGDRFSPLGMNGTQKVKKYFINNKVPRLERGKCPILLSRGKIIWVAGHRIDNSVKVGPQTRRILKAELFLA